MRAFGSRLAPALGMFILVGSCVSWPAALEAQQAPAPPREDVSDFFATDTFDAESLRSQDERYILTLKVEAGQIGLSVFSALVRQGTLDKQVTLEEAETIAYDPKTRRLSLALRRNEARIREISGVLTAQPREFHYVRRFEGQAVFENNRSEPLILTGTANRLKGKPGCFFDLFAGINLNLMTARARYVKDRPEWIFPLAEKEGWQVLRRRIDYQRGEDEFDLSVPGGRELHAIATAGAMQEVSCLSFGGDSQDQPDFIKIIGIPRDRLFADRQGSLRGTSELLALMGTLRFEETPAKAEIEPFKPGEPFILSLSAPGRYFGLIQNGDAEHRLRLKVEAGLSPTAEGSLKEVIRFALIDFARASGGNWSPLNLGNAQPGFDTADILIDWRNRYAEALAKKLDGSVN